MSTHNQLVELLSHADTSWATAQGITRSWRNQDLVTLAFHRHFAEIRATGQPPFGIAFQLTDRDGDDPVIETVLAVAADRPKNRRRADVLSSRGEEYRADCLVIDGATFWARSDGKVITNNGDPGSSHGGADILKLLEPSHIPRGFELESQDAQEEVAGRSCALASAVPVALDLTGRIPGSEAFNMIAGGTEFRLWIDVQLGLLLRVTKLVDSQVAESCEFMEISFDTLLDQTLFAPLT